MLILLFIVCILVGVLLSKVGKNVRPASREEFEIASTLLFILSGLIFGIMIGVMAVLVNGRTIDSRIQMYVEQNQTIETSISDLVAAYMDYESETLTNLSPDSAITLVSMYPELKSDSLVEQQCNLYMENNRKITELKENAIKLSSYKWWLYFGK